MNGSVTNMTAERPAAPAPALASPGRESQELWFALSRRTWRSVVLVPADESGSASAAAESLAEVGRRLRLAPVGALVVERLDYDTAAQLVRRIAATGLPRDGAGPATPDQLVVAIPSVVAEPLGVAVAREADVVVICIELGRTRLAAARETIDLIGPERIAGCLLLL